MRIQFFVHALAHEGEWEFSLENVKMEWIPTTEICISFIKNNGYRLIFLPFNQWASNWFITTRINSLREISTKAISNLTNENLNTHCIHARLPLILLHFIRIYSRTISRRLQSISRVIFPHILRGCYAIWFDLECWYKTKKLQIPFIQRRRWVSLRYCCQLDWRVWCTHQKKNHIYIRLSTLIHRLMFVLYDNGSYRRNFFFLFFRDFLSLMYLPFK